jgi:hypothetical protein
MIQLIELVHVEHPLAPVENLVVLLAYSTLRLIDVTPRNRIIRLALVIRYPRVEVLSRTFW